jgi:signal transduction histidine kinase
MAAQQSKAHRRHFTIPIRWQLLGATVVVGAVAVAIAVSGLQRMQVLNQRMNRIVDIAAEKVKLASLMRQELVAITRAEKGIILARSEDEMNRQAIAIDTHLSELNTIQNQLSELLIPDEKELLDAFASKWGKWQQNHQDLRRFALLNSDMRARELSLGAASMAFDQLESSLQRLGDNFTAELTDALEDAATPKRSNAAAMLSLVAHLTGRATALHRAEKNLILASTEESMTGYEEEFDLLETSFRNGLAELRKLASDEDDTALAATDQAFQDYWDKVSELRTILSDKSNFLVAHFAYDIGEPLGYEAEAILNQLIEKSESRMEQLQAESSSQYAQSRNSLLMISVIGIVLSVAVSFHAGQRIARNLAKLANYARDIHDARDLSKRLPKVSDDEVGMVAEALDQMRQAVYEQSRELASMNDTLAQKNEEMEQFVYTVSHDLKSPLVSCKGLLGLMKEDIADANYPEVVNSASRLEAATDQLSQIIDDLLALSRIGRESQELSNIDMFVVLTDLQARLAERAEAMRVAMNVLRPIPNLVADVGDVTRVFENLLNNAIKYAGDVLQPVVEIGGLVQDGETRYFVRDNGPGIEPAYHERIFGLFQRLDTSKEGTGVGLASVTKIMRMYGGRVWVESSPGNGATFWLAFPQHNA